MTNPTDPRLKPVKVYGKAGTTGTAPRPSSGPSPVLAGILAGVGAAAAWTLIAYLTHYEIGWVAWGVGALIGYAVARSAKEPSPALGVTASAIAVASLILAKVLILELALPSIMRSELLKNEDATAAMFLIQMTENHEFSPQVQAQIDRGPQASSAGFQEDLQERIAEEARARAEAATPAERERVVNKFTAKVLGELGFLQTLAHLFSFWDVLWFVLAIGSAWKIAQHGPD